MALPKIDVTIVGYNEEEILPYTFRHYRQFARNIRYWDAFSTDRSREIAKEYDCEIHDWHTDGLNDRSSMELKNNDWMYPDPSTRADWHINGDADELVYFPSGVEETLAAYDRNALAIIKLKGFEMLADRYPTTKGQIYEEVNCGGDDDRWYGKPALFAPHRITRTSFSAGAHECTVTLGNSENLTAKYDSVPNEPQTYLLHYHHLGGVDRIAARYDATRKRLSATNVNNHWGNFDPGIVHALEKRRGIMQTLRKVV